MISPRDPIEFADGAVTPRLQVDPLGAGIVEELASGCPTSTATESLIDHSRDWWPLAMHWAIAGRTWSMPAAVCMPTSADEVAHVVRVCSRHRIPITPMAGRSSVTGAATPAQGGVALDMTGMNEILDVDSTSGVVCVEPGMFGPELESELRTKHRLTVGHFPQSFDISTVGGWVASRGAGQYSTRYGKIEDIVIGLEVVLADSRVVRLGPHAAAAQGPDLMQLFVGSEGTLGVITKVWLRAHPLADHRRLAAYSFASLELGISAVRDSVRHGATPAVLRLYDDIESARSHAATESRCTLLVLDEGTPEIVDATLSVVDRFVRQHGGRAESVSLVERWLEHRNDVSALAALTHKGFVIDTMEVTSPWSQTVAVVEAVKRAALGVDGVRNASVHLSHSYLDGACLYFTFAAKGDDPDTTYVKLWDAAQHAALDCGATLSHHHGVGMSRARFMHRALGESLAVLRDLKKTLDPHGVFNPGKLALGEEFWP
jgi:alkyldihydroxyacetonephosphate synthase